MMLTERAGSREVFGDLIERFRVSGLLEIWPHTPLPKGGKWLIDLGGQKIEAMLTRQEDEIHLEIIPKEGQEKPILIICTPPDAPAEPAFYLVHPIKRPLNWYPHEEKVSAEIILNLPPGSNEIDILCIPLPKVNLVHLV